MIRPCTLCSLASDLMTLGSRKAGCQLLPLPCCRMRPKTPDCRNSSMLYDLAIMEASDLHFEDQVEMAARTALMLGVHGAALTHELFMPPGEGRSRAWAHARGACQCDPCCMSAPAACLLGLYTNCSANVHG